MARVRETDKKTGKVAKEYDSKTGDVKEVEEQKETVKEEPKNIAPVAESQSFLPNEAVKTIEQFLSWHPLRFKLHVDLYEKLQSQEMMIDEPIFDPSSPTVEEDYKTVAGSFTSYLNFGLTLPFLDFFTSINKLDTSK